LIIVENPAARAISAGVFQRYPSSQPFAGDFSVGAHHVSTSPALAMLLAQKPITPWPSL
jgi:hypothetical protein